MTVASKLQTLAAIKAAQYEAIIAKGGTLSPGDWGAYAVAIEALPTGGVSIPTLIATMPFTAVTEPTGGTVWYVKPDGAGLKDGTSWANAFATRQAAVNAASAGDRVYVWEGTYYLDAVQTPKVGVSEYYGFNDDGSWAKRQPFTHPSKLDAGFTANNFTNTTVVFLDEQIIDGLCIQNVITVRGFNGTLNTKSKNVVVLNCHGAADGGGISMTNNGSLTNFFIGNCTANSYAGFYGTSGFVLTAGKVVNCAASGVGGTNITINQVTAICCQSTSGGGFIVSTNVVLDGCVAIDCVATTGFGGGFHISYGNVYAINCVAINCQASGSGGGFYVHNVALARNCTTIGCTSPLGAFFVSTSYTFYNNVSWGDGFYFGVANGPYKIYNCASNFALTGATNWGTVADVQNFIALTDFPFAAPGIAPFDGSGAYYTNLAKGEEALAFVSRSVLPRLTDAHLPAGSPLIGAGYYEAGVTPETDADGKERPITPSIGAYEP